MPSQQADRIRILVSVLFLLIIAAGAVVWLGRRAEPPPLVITTPTSGPAAVAPTTLAAQSTSIKVYVSGAVARPGVVEMHPGERVEDAILLAGGSLPDSDLTNLNLAARVKDEQHIRVPRQGEPASAQSGQGGAPGKINLNTATLAELDALPGIGTAIGNKIIAYRQAQGGFRSVEELIQAKLVNQKTYEVIKDMVTVQ